MNEKRLDKNTLSILKDSCDEKKLIDRWVKDMNEFLFAKKLPSEMQAKLLILDAFSEKQPLETQLLQQQALFGWLMTRMAEEIATTRKMILILTDSLDSKET